MAFLEAIFATIIVSCVSLVGIFTLYFKGLRSPVLLPMLVSFAAGSMIAVSFFDLLPEALGKFQLQGVMLFTVLGFLVFLGIEKLTHWHHHAKSREKSAGYLVLIGDGVHNFFDGVAIAASFIAGSDLGLLTTISVIFHEIPQEIGDFVILLHAKFTVKKALLYNLISALAAVLGVLFTFYFSAFTNSLAILLPFSAGGFIYLASVDLVPEMHKELDPKKSAMHFALFIAGIAVIWLVINYLG